MLRIHQLLFILCTAAFALSAQQTSTPSAQNIPAVTSASAVQKTSVPAVPAVQKTSEEFHYFQQSGNALDTLICRIQFKISYSWMKSKEYFKLALFSPVDALPAKGRDIEARINLKTESISQKASDLQKQAIEAGKSKISETAANITEQSEKLKAQAIQAGSEWKKEAESELTKNLGK